MSEAEGSARQQDTLGEDGSQHLTFSVGQEEYGVDILMVQEIKGYSTVTPLPNTPPYVKGVMNLRGTIVPVFDLRTKFFQPAVEYNKFTVIVVVVLNGRATGLVVDSVSDVLNISPRDIQALPEFSAQVDTSFIKGLAKVGEKLVILLDIARVVNDRALEPLAETPLAS